MEIHKKGLKMDIVKNKSKVNFKRIGLIIALAVTCVFISAKLWSSAQNISLNVDALKVQTAKVMLFHQKLAALFQKFISSQATK